MSELTDYKLPPQDINIEQCALGSMMLESNAAFEVIDIVDASDFYREAHRSIFEAIKDLVLKNEPVDIITIQSELKKRNSLDSIGGVSYLSEVLSLVPTAANAEHYAKIVKEKSLARNLLSTCTSVITDIYHSGKDVSVLLDSAEADIFAINSDSVRKDFLLAKDVLQLAMENLQKEDTGDCVNSGYPDLEKYTGGFRGGQLIVIAARPAMGKTSLVMNFVRTMALRDKKTVAIFTLEMSNIEVIGRLLCSEAHVDMSSFASKKIMNDKNSMSKMLRVASELSEAKIIIDDSSALSPTEIISKCRRIKSRYKELDVIIIDYIQLMSSSKKNYQGREQEISEISRSLKVLAKEFDVPVIALSQLNRDVTKQKRRPVLSDIRESGAIEQDADMIIFIHKDQDEMNSGTNTDNTVEIIVAKNRNGPSGITELAWFPESTSFESLSFN